MFRTTRPTQERIAQRVVAARDIELTSARILHADADSFLRPPQRGFVFDSSASLLGVGGEVFAAARQAFERWEPFNLGWMRVANPEARIAVGEVVAVEVRSLGLWTVNLSRIVDVVDTAERFGFVYSTTELHVEQGEERFLLRLEAATGEVRYELQAVSRPRAALARLGYPVTRAYQRRFARESHRQMREAVRMQDGNAKRR